MGCFSGRLMSSASDQKLFCKLSSPFCCSFHEFVEEKVISPSYSSAILTPPPGRTDVEAETPIFWPPDVMSGLIWKDPDVGKDWRQEEKGTTEDEMVARHHRLNGHDFGWTLGVGDGQGGLAFCSSWGPKQSNTTKQLNWTERRKKMKMKKSWTQGSTAPIIN